MPEPALAAGEVLLQMLAAGINNTDISTRVGWYSPSIKTATETAATSAAAAPATLTDGGWNKKTPFPLIQGTDCCGRIVAVAPDDRTR